MSAKVKQELVAANDPVPLAPSQGGGLTQVLDRVLRDPSIPMERVEKVWEMIQRIEQQNAKTAWQDAMTLAQAEMEMVVKDSRNDQTRSNYASFAALDTAIRPIYTKHGFALTWDTGEGGFGPVPENHVRVLCDVLRGAYSRPYHFDIPADGKGAKGNDMMSKTHAAGSAFKYGRRYLLEGIFNIATGDKRNDDDGNAASSGSVEFISQKKWEELTKLADEIGMRDEELCKHCGVDDLSRLSAKNGDIVIRKLQKTKQMRSAKR